MGSGAHGQLSPPRPVGVFLDFDQKYSVDAIEEMRQQAERLLEPLGFALDWHRLEENDGTQTFPHLAVMRFHGACDGTAVLEPQPWDVTPVLASSVVSGGNVLPFAEVYCDDVRRFLYSELKGVQIRQRERTYGHALGFLVAHEVYHILTNSVHHDQEGAGKSHHHPQDLLSQSLNFVREARR